MRSTTFGRQFNSAHESNAISGGESLANFFENIDVDVGLACQITEHLQKFVIDDGRSDDRDRTEQ